MEWLLIILGGIVVLLFLMNLRLRERIYRAEQAHLRAQAENVALNYLLRHAGGGRLLNQNITGLFPAEETSVEEIEANPRPQGRTGTGMQFIEVVFLLMLVYAGLYIMGFIH